MFDEINDLIDRRETDGNLERAVELLMELKQANPEKDIVRGKLSNAYFYVGLFAEEGSSARKDAFEKGVEYGKEAITLNPDALYGNFWYASNLGYLGMIQGVLSSLASIDPFRKSMEIVLKANENFFRAGPHRALGRLYHQAPGWPISIGNKNKAGEHLERAVELAGDFFANRLYLAEFYVDMGKRDAAIEQLQWAAGAELNSLHVKEDGVYKEQAEELLKRLS